MNLEQVKTTKDLNKYLEKHPSPVAAYILQRAIRFFAVECRKNDGKFDWRAITKRKEMGLSFRLMDETEINADVASALRSWVTSPGHGLCVGTSFLDQSTSQAARKGSDPRDEAHRILNFFISK